MRFQCVAEFIFAYLHFVTQNMKRRYSKERVKLKKSTILINDALTTFLSEIDIFFFFFFSV